MWPLLVRKVLVLFILVSGTRRPGVSSIDQARRAKADRDPEPKAMPH